MIVREPVYHKDVDAIAALLLEAGGEGTTDYICRSRASECIKRGKTRDTSVCLVAEGKHGPTGILYASEVQAFDLAKDMRFMYVHYLIGEGCGIPLMRELRRRTNLRITLAQWAYLYSEKPEAVVARFMRMAGGRPAGRLYEF